LSKHASDRDCCPPSRDQTSSLDGRRHHCMQHRGPRYCRPSTVDPYYCIRLVHIGNDSTASLYCSIIVSEKTVRMPEHLQHLKQQQQQLCRNEGLSAAVAAAPIPADVDKLQAVVHLIAGQFYLKPSLVAAAANYSRRRRPRYI